MIQMIQLMLEVEMLEMMLAMRWVEKSVVGMIEQSIGQIVSIGHLDSSIGKIGSKRIHKMNNQFGKELVVLDH